MKHSMRVLWCLALTTSVGLLAPTRACADRRPTLTSDGFYVGLRANPGEALVGAWDLDIYLTRNRAVSIGPGVSFAALGDNTRGLDQDFVLAADFVRVKVGVNEPGGTWRPFFLLGGGLTYAQLPATPMRGRPEQILPELREFAALLTVGAGGDLYTRGPIAFSTMLLTRCHLSGTDRIPDVWLELDVGLRFGI